MKFRLIYIINNFACLDLDRRTLWILRGGGGAGKFLLCQIGTLATATPVTGPSLTAFTGHTMAVEILADLLTSFWLLSLFTKPLHLLTNCFHLGSFNWLRVCSAFLQLPACCHLISHLPSEAIWPAAVDDDRQGHAVVSQGSCISANISKLCGTLAEIDLPTAMDAMNMWRNPLLSQRSACKTVAYKIFERRPGRAAPHRAELRVWKGSCKHARDKSSGVHSEFESSKVA